MTVVVVMLTVNQRAKTLRCLKSLEEVTEPQCQIVLWDNGSVDETAEAVGAAYPHVFVHTHPTNLGAAEGRNRAADLATREFNASHLVFLDNDMVVTPGFLLPLLAPFAERGDRLAQTSSKIRFLDEPDRLGDAGGSKIRFWLGSTKPVGYRELDHGQHDLPRECIPPTGSMAVRADVFKEVGGFDTRFDPYGMEDLDFSLRVAKAGYYALYVPESVVYHESKPPEDRPAEVYGRNRARNWLLLMNRHASIPEKAGFVCIGLPLITLRLFLKLITGRGGGLSKLTELFGVMRRSAHAEGREGP